MSASSAQVISDINECKRLWNEFSPKHSVFQTWEFRKAFITGFGYKPYFLYLDESPKKRGLLPLWYNSDDKKYEWVGGDWPEDNEFFTTSSDVTKRLIVAAKRPLELCALLPFEGMDELTAIGSIKQDEYLKYVLRLDGIETFEQLMSSFSKKHRYNLKYDYKKILAQNTEIIWKDTTDRSYFDYYVELKGVVFDGDGEDDGNYYKDKRRKEAFRQIIKNADEYTVRVMQIKINGKRAGIDIVLLYKDSYYLIGGAYDVKRFSGVGAAALYLLFEDAVKQKAKLVDCLQEESGWKHRYFEGKPLYIFEAK